MVVVGYPATPIITSRVRFCISAAHTREDLDLVLEKVSEIGDILGMKVSARKYIALVEDDLQKKNNWAFEFSFGRGIINKHLVFWLVVV